MLFAILLLTVVCYFLPGVFLHIWVREREFSLLALTVRLSGSITTPASFWPRIKYLYSPAYFLLAAQLSDHLLMAYVSFYALVWLARQRPTARQYLTIAVAIPALGVALCLPWVARVLPLVSGINVHEPQRPAFAQAGYLELVQDFDGAQIWKVKPKE